VSCQPSRTCLLRLGVAILVGCLSTLTVAQQSTKAQDPRKDYALIFGTVWTPQNQPAYGIPIKIRRADEKKARWELMSDHSGEFAQRVPVGKQDYVVWADIKAPKGVEKPQVTAHVESDERVDVFLHLTEQHKQEKKK
jgi:hypothetical protein